MSVLRPALSSNHASSAPSNVNTVKEKAALFEKNGLPITAPYVSQSVPPSSRPNGAAPHLPSPQPPPLPVTIDPHPSPLALSARGGRVSPAVGGARHAPAEAVQDKHARIQEGLFSCNAMKLFSGCTTLKQSWEDHFGKDDNAYLLRAHCFKHTLTKPDMAGEEHALIFAKPIYDKYKGDALPRYILEETEKNYGPYHEGRSHARGGWPPQLCLALELGLFGSVDVIRSSSPPPVQRGGAPPPRTAEQLSLLIGTLEGEITQLQQSSPGAPEITDLQNRVVNLRKQRDALRQAFRGDIQSAAAKAPLNIREKNSAAVAEMLKLDELIMRKKAEVKTAKEDKTVLEVCKKEKIDLLNTELKELKTKHDKLEPLFKKLKKISEDKTERAHWLAAFKNDVNIALKYHKIVADLYPSDQLGMAADLFERFKDKITEAKEHYK